MKADKSNFWAYNKRLQPVANKLRHRMTRAEVVLWVELLRASQMMGYPFRRQRPILGFVVDFMCKNLNLVIEVDGGYHERPDAREKDRWRQQMIEDAGFKVIRFKNEEVLTNLGRVRKSIEEAIRELEGAGAVTIPKRPSTGDLPLTPSKRGNSRRGRERRG